VAVVVGTAGRQGEGRCLEEPEEFVELLEEG